MGRPLALLLAALASALAGWVVAAGVTLWTDERPGGSVAAEWAVGLLVGVVAFVVLAPVMARLSERRLLGRARRNAGGVGVESASADRRETTATPEERTTG